MVSPRKTNKSTLGRAKLEYLYITFDTQLKSAPKFLRMNFFVWFLRDGLMVSALVSGSTGTGSSSGRGHCVVFLGKTLYSHSTSLHPGAQMGTGEFNAGGNPAMD